MKHLVNKNRGFIALISVVIISFVLLLVALTLSMKSFYTRMNILDSENKKISNELANACIEHARLMLAVDKSINDTGTVNGTIAVGSEICDYTITTAGVINTHGSKNDAHTYYKATINENIPEIPITDFKELANYP